ncbi:CGNR zinc finger domain-containing protein [Streptomyces sp. NPDC048696]|uniref:CGNR zinc finger domain-containing protein n=1 Tax=Streptomyces sp. NPDC048696 TaxID=3365585 RepID=UPI003722023D
MLVHSHLGIVANRPRHHTEHRQARKPQHPEAEPALARGLDGVGVGALSTAALAPALWLSERGYCAWGRCAAPGCDRYFIDTGRRAPQRYGSTRCGTRVRVTAHRNRSH